jgi:hypothetical protein
MGAVVLSHIEIGEDQGRTVSNRGGERAARAPA